IIDYCDEPLVSIDFKTNSHSSILDTGLTQVIGDHTIKMLLWYDNEWGYANRLVNMMELLNN
ncbi:type I glyceraldehyde-3-phosphate dehydrogenase, partial [candidate division KSB1 bacterium]